MLGYALFTMLYGSDRIVEFARIDLGQVLSVLSLSTIVAIAGFAVMAAL